jgi:Holliday junction resolvase
VSSTAYQIGRRFEYRVRNHFRSLGYYVMRSPQSKSPVDLIVLGHNVVLLVQCKVSGHISPDAWNELYFLARDTCGCTAVLAERVKRKIVMHELTGTKKRFAREKPWAQIAPGVNECAECPGHRQQTRARAAARPPLAA